MVSALSSGDCVVCSEPYRIGNELGLLADGWAHLECFELVLATTAQLELWARGGRR
jgi:hypothetical protein